MSWPSPTRCPTARALIGPEVHPGGAGTQVAGTGGGSSTGFTGRVHGPRSSHTPRVGTVSCESEVGLGLVGTVGGVVMLVSPVVTLPVVVGWCPGLSSGRHAASSAAS